jgi:hypothetical protein
MDALLVTNQSAVAIKAGITNVINLHGFGVFVDICCLHWKVVISNDAATNGKVQDCKLRLVEFPTILS